MVKVSEIYKDVVKHYGWEKYSDGKERLLRMKYATLQQKLVLCDKSEFKRQGNNVVPSTDAPIIRNILIEAVSGDEDNIIADWFNGKVDTDKSLMSILLFNCLKPLIMQPCFSGETDEVTMDEWLAAVAAAVKYPTAVQVSELSRNLELFRNNSLALDMNIGIGDVVVRHEDGHRSYGLQGKEREIDIEGKTIDEVLEDVVSQDDYFDVLAQVLRKFDGHAKKRAHDAILWYANAKNIYDAQKADDAFEHESIASEYNIWYQRVHEFLESNPEICRKIEEEASVEGLSEFFRMADR